MNLQEIHAEIRRLRSETDSRLQYQQQQTTALQTQLNNTAAAITATIIEPDITNTARNTDFVHSVDSLLNVTPVVGNQQHECALYYSHAPDRQVYVYDASMTSGSGVVNLAASAAFTAGDVGEAIIIDGAGAANAPLIGTIGTYNNANQIVLAGGVVAGTTVEGTRCRFRVKQLGMSNAKTSVAVVTDVVKTPTHANFASNATHPVWDKVNGLIEMGGTRTLTHFLGVVSASGVFTSQLQPFTPNTSIWCQFRIARANKFVKLKGFAYAGLWNNSASALEFLKAETFDITSQVIGTPAATTTAQYFVVLSNGLNQAFVSKIATVANAPTSASFSRTVRVALSWPAFPGIIKTQIYRKLGAGNVELLETIAANAGSYTDENFAGRIDTGSGAFPVITNSTSEARAIAFTTDFAAIPVNGNGDWVIMKFLIPLLPTSSFANVSEIAMVIGFTEAVSYFLAGVTTNGTTAIVAPEAIFTAAMSGLTVKLTDSADPARQHTATMTFVNALNATLSAAVPWTSSTTEIEILEANPRGLLIDKVGFSINNGKWAIHPDDTRAAQLQAAQPATSSQGNNPTGGGFGGNQCVVVDTSAVATRKGQITLNDLTHEHDLLNPGASARGFNKIKHLQRSTVCEYYHVVLGSGKMIACTLAHRLVTDTTNTRTGTPLQNLRVGDTVLTRDGQDSIAVIEKITCSQGISVISIELEIPADPDGTEHLLLINDIWCHNVKVHEV